MRGVPGSSPGPPIAAPAGVRAANAWILVNRLDVLYTVAALLTAPWWARKARYGWAERFALTLPELPARGGRTRVMLHAVSVGEVNALRELVPLLAGEAEVIVTAGTDTGLARARELYGGISHVLRYPLDASGAVTRFLDHVRPQVVGLVELELWPNFVRACRERDVPVAVINGRLSERSFRGYRRVRRWMRPSFASLAAAAVQDETYAGRFRDMGVAPDRVVVTGSMKFDSARIEDEVEGAESLRRAMGIDPERPLVVAGSTGPGEEALIRQACERGLGDGVQLLCAPRRPERFGEAAAALPGCVRRTAGAPGRGARLYLLDTLGELRQAYALADVVVVGRSFFDQHGSDPIEPVALGKATVIGPAVSDFAEIVAALESAGGLVRATRDDLHEALTRLMADGAKRGSLAERGRACIRSMQGASRRHADLLLGLTGVAREKEGPPTHAGGALESPSARA